jgi:Flp pilus assembly protein TadD
MLPLLAAIATAIVFAPAVAFEFVNFDDQGYVTGNPLVLSGLSPALFKAAFTSFIMDNWHPLTVISLAADIEVFGVNPAAMHAVNILLHAVNTALLCVLLQKMTTQRWLPFIAALIFGLHPLRIESVAWISERKDVLSTFFWLATTLMYVSYCRTRPSTTRYLLVVALFALGLMAKPMLVTLPFTLLLLDYWPLQRFGPTRAVSVIKILAEKLPLLTLAALVAFACYRAQHNALAGDDLNFGGKILRAASSVWEYLARTFVPVDLAAFYPPAPGGYYTATSWIILTAIAVISVLLLRQYRTRPWLAVGWAWFLGTLVPVIGLVQVGQQAFADRYTYIPHIGLLIAVIWGLAETFTSRQRLAGGVAATSICCLAVLSTMHLPTWKDSLSLWHQAFLTQPEHYVIRKNLGLSHVQAGEARAALPHLQKSLELVPDAIMARRDLGLIQLTLDDLAGAEAQFRTCLAMKPDWQEARELLAMTHELNGDPGAAKQLWHELQTESDTLTSNLGLASAASKSGDTEAAQIRLAAVDSRWPQWRQELFVYAWSGATSAISIQRNAPQAILSSFRLSQLDSDNPQILDLVAASYASAGNFERARLYGEAASSLAASNPDFRDLQPALVERLSLYRSNQPYRQPSPN